MIDSKINSDVPILILIVLYKCPLTESATINSIIAQEEKFYSYKLVIWDNSPSPVSNQHLNELRKSIDFEYISRPENVSLSKVYNTIIADYNFDYVLLLDQDTGIPANYFKSLNEHLVKYSHINLFLPIVKNGDLIVSPGSFHYFKGKHWKAAPTGIVKAKNVLAVTSGMFISKSYFNNYNYKFDERLNLYGIDSSFMLQYADNERELCIIPLTFAHNSALWSNPSADVLLPRFKNLTYAWKMILKDKPGSRFLYSIYSIYLSVKLAIKYSDIRFLK